jgi:hypothetical protein
MNCILSKDMTRTTAEASKAKTVLSSYTESVNLPEECRLFRSSLAQVSFLTNLNSVSVKISPLKFAVPFVIFLVYHTSNLYFSSLNDAMHDLALGLIINKIYQIHIHSK